MRYLIISCSYNPQSRSRALAQIVLEHVESRDARTEFIDLPDLDLPFCDAGPCYSLPNVQKIGQAIEEASGIIVAAPIYNYDLSAAAKNLLELTGRAWTGKVVGFVCAAGGHASYMSVMPFANSLMLDFRCFVLPRFVYAPKVPIDDEFFGDAALNRRADDLAAELVRVTGAMHPEGD